MEDTVMNDDDKVKPMDAFFTTQTNTFVKSSTAIEIQE
jgi:hypothetical protein